MKAGDLSTNKDRHGPMGKPGIYHDQEYIKEAIVKNILIIFLS